MDSTVVVLFVLSTLIGGVVTGLAGFAFGLVVSGLWLHLITPLEAATLIVAFGLPVQAYGIWRLRHAFNWRHVVPIVIGGTFGAPAGVWLLHLIEPAYLRLGIGVLLVAYSLYGLTRPAVKPLPAHVPAEIVLGFFNGLLGGMTGLSGVFVTIWCGMRGWSKDEQRAVYQPVLFGSAIVTAVALIYGGAITAKVVHLAAFGAPALALGVWIGFTLYHRVDDATFRKIVLILLLLSGIALIVPELFAAFGALARAADLPR
jgi:uncharacterized membrane protein YfcA